MLRDSKEDMNKVLKFVEEMNDDILEVIDKHDLEDYCILLTYQSDGGICWVEWAGEQLWHSDNGGYEDFKEGIMIEMRRIIKLMQNIKFLEDK